MEEISKCKVAGHHGVRTVEYNGIGQKSYKKK
jgi:hypothetical protein